MFAYAVVRLHGVGRGWSSSHSINEIEHDVLDEGHPLAYLGQFLNCYLDVCKGVLG